MGFGLHAKSIFSRKGRKGLNAKAAKKENKEGKEKADHVFTNCYRP